MKIAILRILDIALSELVGKNRLYSHEEFVDQMLKIEAYVKDSDDRGQPAWLKAKKQHPICVEFLIFSMGFPPAKFFSLSITDRLFSFSEIIYWDIPNSIIHKNFEVLQKLSDGDPSSDDYASEISYVVQKLVTDLQLTRWIERIHQDLKNEKSAQSGPHDRMS